MENPAVKQQCLQWPMPMALSGARFQNLLCWAVQTLSQQFPESDWIVAQAAVAQYNLRNFDGAQELFEDLIERDPHRVEVKPATKPYAGLNCLAHAHTSSQSPYELRSGSGFNGVWPKHAACPCSLPRDRKQQSRPLMLAFAALAACFQARYKTPK